LAIESCKTQNPFILEIVEIYKSRGNALDDHVSNCYISYTDFKPFIMKYF